MKEILPLLDFDPKTKDGITNITIWLAMLVYFLVITLFIVPLNVPNPQANYGLYLFVLFVPAATKLIFFSGDPISYRKNKEALFFQQQFPDKYVASKYSIELPYAQVLWFRCLDKRPDDGDVKRTYQYGYTCRLVYYIRRLTGWFTVITAILILREAAVKFFSQHHGWAGIPALCSSLASVENIRGKAVYLAHLAVISTYLLVANRPDATEATGVWAKWKHINDRNKAWIDQFQTLDQLKTFIADKPQAIGSSAPVAADPKPSQAKSN